MLLLAIDTWFSARSEQTPVAILKRNLKEQRGTTQL
jgi:hypothetical protein